MESVRREVNPDGGFITWKTVGGGSIPRLHLVDFPTAIGVGGCGGGD